MSDTEYIRIPSGDFLHMRDLYALWPENDRKIMAHAKAQFNEWADANPTTKADRERQRGYMLNYDNIMQALYEKNNPIK